MSDHERIWLEPGCCYNDYEGRMWSKYGDAFEHNGDPDDDEHRKPTEYVRADLYAELETRDTSFQTGAALAKKEIAGLETELAKLRKSRAGYRGWCGQYRGKIEKLEALEQNPPCAT